MEKDKNQKGNGSRSESGLRRHQTLHPPSSFPFSELDLLASSATSSPFFLLISLHLLQLDIVFEQAGRRRRRRMAFQGTTTKCTACEKTVYLVDKLTADNRIYHKACFRCHHCKGTLKLGNYNSFEGVLYCRPHFDQIFKMTGSLDKSFEGTPKVARPEKHVEKENASKVSSAFAGTREKCVGCKKTVYPIERVVVNGTAYHKSCFKCCHGGCVISPSNYIAHEGKLYCKHHHIQLFKEKGNYSQLENDEATAKTEAPVA